MGAPRVLHLGGNGHCAVRLDPVRAALAEAGDPFELVDLPLPGFEGRPAAPDLEAFLRGLAAPVAAAPPALLYASGIGALLGLTARARGHLGPVPLLMQAPVLWGLERRVFPRLMRFAPVRALVTGLFRFPPFQAHFTRKYFRRPVSRDFAAAYFRGYRDCAAFADLFEWVSPALLRELEAAFAADPGLLDDIHVWWGGHDKVVDTAELAVTEAALGRRFPLTRFPDWGHYPMLDQPAAWVAAVAAHLAGGEPAGDPT